MQAGLVFGVDLHEHVDGSELAVGRSGDGDTGDFADGDAFQLDGCADFESLGVVKVGVDDDLVAEEAHARGAGHEEEQDAEQGNGDEHDHADLELRPFDFLLARHRAFLWRMAHVATWMAGVAPSYQPEDGGCRACGDSDARAWGVGAELCCASVFGDDDGDGGGAGVGERKREVANAEARGNLCGTAVKVQLRALAGEAADLDLAPVDAAADAGAEGLGSGLFGGKARGQAFGVVLLRHAVGDLAGSVDAVKEGLAEALVAALDPVDFDEVSAEAEDQAGTPWG